MTFFFHPGKTLPTLADKNLLKNILKLHVIFKCSSNLQSNEPKKIHFLTKRKIIAVMKVNNLAVHRFHNIIKLFLHITNVL